MTADELAKLKDILTRQPALEDPGPAELRAQMAQFADFLPKPEDATREPAEVGGVPAEWFTVPGVREGRTILYLHGGGYVMGMADAYVKLVCDIARPAKARALFPDYRLAPEHPFPAQLEDALAAYRWLIEQGADPAKLAVAGDSAGGGLAAATLVAARDAALPMPAAAVMISPWADMEGSSGTREDLRKSDPMIRFEHMEKIRDWFLAGADPRDSRASPIHADLSGLPPMLIQAGGAEMIRDDARLLAERARAAGVEVTLDEWPGMFHVWQFFAHMLSEGRDALERIGAFLDARLA